MENWMLLYAAAGLLFSVINAYLARKRGYFFWRTFFFSLLLALAVFALLLKVVE